MTELLPPVFEVEYKWKATRPDDYPLGIRTMFLLTIIVLVGLVSVVVVVYDRDSVRGAKKPSTGVKESFTPSSGIHVRKRTHSK